MVMVLYGDGIHKVMMSQGGFINCIITIVVVVVIVHSSTILHRHSAISLSTSSRPVILPMTVCMGSSSSSGGSSSSSSGQIVFIHEFHLQWVDDRDGVPRVRSSTVDAWRL